MKSFSKVDKDKKRAFTYDNDTEFSKYESTGAKLAWKYILLIRITVGNVVPNKNTHRLLKQYFPKKSLFATLTQKAVDGAITFINHRPRKRLGYLTPYEVFVEGKSIAVHGRM